MLSRWVCKIFNKQSFIPLTMVFAGIQRMATMRVRYRSGITPRMAGQAELYA